MKKRFLYTRSLWS